MGLFDWLTPRNPTKSKIVAIKTDIEKLVTRKCAEKFSVDWYGAYDIDPKHLVFWICIKTDEMKNRLISDVELNRELRGLLDKRQYLESARELVHIGFESQETVDRESAGNWYHHFK